MTISLLLTGCKQYNESLNVYNYNGKMSKIKKQSVKVAKKVHKKNFKFAI